MSARCADGIVRRSMPGCIAAIDQGTTSTRCILFDRNGRAVSLAQREHRQIYPRPGWVEHDPREIWRNTHGVVREAMQIAGAVAADIAGVGVTNQRETVVFWDRRSGEPIGNAIVWQDTRTAEICKTLAAAFGAGRFRERTGLPISTYFTGPKVRWALENRPGLRERVGRGEAVAGTIDAWLIWSLTGGPNGGAFVTDVSNASRTLLMGLRSLDWEDDLLDAVGATRTMLPRITPCIPAEPWGYTTKDGPFGGRVPVCAALGDQQAALFGQCCFGEGDIKNTYGTGCFMLMNTGARPVASAHGLLTTVAMQRESEPPVYALEGAIAIAGALVQWLRDNLGIIRSAAEVEQLAREVEDNGDVYFVPAFSGLFAPHWRPDARGVIAGLTRYANRAHIARAALEATCLQTLDVLDAMRQDAGINPESLRVDGGMTANSLLMQLQADILSMPVVRPSIAETTALGAAFAAGLASGFYESPSSLRSLWRADQEWRPEMMQPERDRLLMGWRKALDRSLGWTD